MWRKWFKIFGARVAITIDFDGQARYRFIKKINEDYFVCKAICDLVLLNKDGTVHGRSYIDSWIEV